jgi:pimeloyl-ACP methyl ester carboxylesterase
VNSIVFVHGLTGNRDKTWTHGNGVSWIKNLLPQDLPNARIMSFGYDADVVRFWTIAGSNKLYDHGKSLAYAVLDRRFGIEQRPIIFVAHSLGGLVCEAALILSDKRDEISSILKNTLGVAFLGTPHGGSDLANWGVTVAQYVNVFRGTNRNILKNLQPGSSDLQQVEDDFQHLLHRQNINLKIFCFFEELKMNDMIGKIVEDRSAIMRGYDSCSIHADHRNMTRFSGRSDAGYRQVLGLLQRWLQDVHQETSSRNTLVSEDSDEKSDGKQADNSGIHFHGSIKGHNVVSGTHTHAGGTTNFTFN